MHGGLVSAGRIELVGFAVSAILMGYLNRGVSRFGGVFGSQIRAKCSLPYADSSRLRENDLLVSSARDRRQTLQNHPYALLNSKNGRTFFTPQPVIARLRRIVDAAGRARLDAYTPVTVDRHCAMTNGDALRDRELSTSTGCTPSISKPPCRALLVGLRSGMRTPSICPILRSCACDNALKDSRFSMTTPFGCDTGQ